MTLDEYILEKGNFGHRGRKGLRGGSLPKSAGRGKDPNAGLKRGLLAAGVAGIGAGAIGGSVLLINKGWKSSATKGVEDLLNTAKRNQEEINKNWDELGKKVDGKGYSWSYHNDAPGHGVNADFTEVQKKRANQRHRDYLGDPMDDFYKDNNEHGTGMFESMHRHHDSWKRNRRRIEALGWSGATKKHQIERLNKLAPTNEKAGKLRDSLVKRQKYIQKRLAELRAKRGEARSGYINEPE